MQGGGDFPLVLRRGLPGPAQAPAAAEPLTAERLAALRREAGAPAIAAAGQRRGGPPAVWVDGERALGSGQAATPADRWHIGSITKSFTATLTARLVEAGSIGWDDTVGERLAAVAPEMRPEYRAASFRHLLSHRSGLPANIPMPELLRFSRDNPDPREERRAYARIALGQAPVAALAAKYEYSNSGYVVAGAMLEAALGEPWEALVRRHLFEPFGLGSAGFGAPAPDQPLGHNAGADVALRPYRPGADLVDNPAVLGPAGRIHIGLPDMLTYLAAHRDLAGLLKPASWHLLHRPPFGGDYALGWVVRSDGALWHNGSNTLWYAEAAFDAKTGLAGFAAVNDGRLGAVAPSVARALRGAVAAA
jgi:CubicO group peptidase (beta-lactamase class C family)